MDKARQNMLKGRSCYGHLGGTLGKRLFERLLELGWFEQDSGKVTVFSLTEIGIEEFKKLGVEIYKKS